MLRCGNYRCERRTKVQQPNQNYLVVGHVTKDIAHDSDFLIGGTVTYAGFMAKQLGWHPVIVTSASSDFRPPTQLADASWHISLSVETTTFRNVYCRSGRRQRIGPVAQPINAADIPASHLDSSLVHLGPVAQEVDLQLAALFEQNPLLVTPQGWMRHWDNHGNIFRMPWHGAGQLLQKSLAVVISIEDIGGDWNTAESWAQRATVLLVTEGEGGCTVFYEGQRKQIPARPTQVVDPTGAGDVFAAAFFIRYFESNDVFQSARFANVAASLSVEWPGIDGLPTRRKVEDYLTVESRV